MMKLISGQPGNGKTLRAMAMMVEEYERNKAANALPQDNEKWEPLRDFFTNVEGATTSDNPKAFPWVQAIPEHNDWRKLPDGSFVMYDEAHADGNTEGLERYGVLFPGTGKPGESDDARIRAMSTHRHRGFDLIFMTQWPNKIHHNVRTLIGEHVHMNRAMGLASAGVVKWTRVQPDPYDEKQREKAEEEIWRFPKELYCRYKSSSRHTSSHKFKIPRKVWSALSMLVVGVLVCWMLYGFLVPESKAKTTDAKPGQGQASLLAAAPAQLVDSSLMPGVGNYYQLNTAPSPTLAGCVSSHRGCRCFNGEGFQIDMERRECERLLEHPLPFNVYHEFKAPQGGGAQAGGGSAPTETALSAAMITAPQVSGYGDIGVGNANPVP